MPNAASPKPRQSRVQFEPKLLTVLREGYGLADLRADMIAGLTVAIVALPLSMAIAIASGVGPERGLFTAIIGGFLVSALGGSRFQIGGPAGAFIVLVSACVADIGVDGLILATFLSGFLLLGMGLLRLGSYIKFIPYPVTVGFTAGIGVIIFSSQIKDLLGLHLTGSEPGPILEKLATLWQARDTLTPAALSVAVATVVLILGLRAVRPRWPGMLIAVVIVSAAAVLIGLPVETIYSRFGDLPRLPPWPALPVLSLATVGAALPYALSFTLLGAIESLLSAVVADGMSGHRHRPNAELLAQGVANSAAAIFGGFCVTGTIARTATNVRAGSRGPLSGMFHAIFVLAFLLIAAPLAGYIPLAALAGVLALVAWNMIERAEIAALVRTSPGDALVLAVTFGLVVLRDLTEGIVVGFALGGLIFIQRMSENAKLEAPNTPQMNDNFTPQDQVVVYRIRGAFFFGAAARVASALDDIGATCRHFVLDFDEVPFVDSTAAHVIESLARKMARRDGRLYLTGTNTQVRQMLNAQGVDPQTVDFCTTITTALNAIAAPPRKP